MINKVLVTISLFALIPSTICAQNYRQQDLSLWSWFQLQKKIGKRQYLEFQYQIRINENITQFNRSNFYFIYGVNVMKNLKLEALYQYNTNYEVDQHTFYVGSTIKQKLTRHFSLFYRTAFQMTRNYFTGVVMIDKPIFAWRNRIRAIYKINNLFSVAFSAEPYLENAFNEAFHLSRIRLTSLFTYRFNKYQSLSTFYLFQPDVISFSRPKNNYAIGVVYHIDLPKSWKTMKKLFKPSGIKADNEEQEDAKDSFN